MRLARFLSNLREHVVPERSAATDGCKIYHSALSESPLVDYTYEEPEGHSRTLSPSTVALAKSPKAKAKAERMFAKTPFNIKVVFLNAGAKWTHPRHVRQSRSSAYYAGDITAFTSNKWGLYELDPKLHPYVHAFRSAIKSSNPEVQFKKFVHFILKAVMWQKPGISWITYSDTGEPVASSSSEAGSRLRLQPGQTLKPSKTEAQLRTQMTRYENFMTKVEQLKPVWDELCHYRYMMDKHDEENDLEVPEQIKPTPDAITIVINSDDGTDFVPFTPWMIAHRFGHSFGEVGGSVDPIDPILQQFNKSMHYAVMLIPSVKAAKRVRPEPIIWGLMAKIGKFKTAREINFGSTGEFVLDCFAQYLTQGRVSFNPVPDRIVPTMATRYLVPEEGLPGPFTL